MDRKLEKKKVIPEKIAFLFFWCLSEDLRIHKDRISRLQHNLWNKVFSSVRE